MSNPSPSENLLDRKLYFVTPPGPTRKNGVKETARRELAIRLLESKPAVEIAAVIEEKLRQQFTLEGYEIREWQSPHLTHMAQFGLLREWRTVDITVYDPVSTHHVRIRGGMSITYRENHNCQFVCSIVIQRPPDAQGFHHPEGTVAHDLILHAPSFPDSMEPAQVETHLTDLLDILNSPVRRRNTRLRIRYLIRSLRRKLMATPLEPLVNEDA